MANMMLTCTAPGCNTGSQGVPFKTSDTPSCEALEFLTMQRTELSIFENIITCCVTMPTIQARTSELHRIWQELGQPKSKSRQCEMKLTCTSITCQTELNYIEPVILGLFINGVSDMELQQALRAEQNMTLSKAVT